MNKVFSKFIKMHKSIIFIFFLLFTSLKASAQTSVKTHEGVEIGGIKQWIGARSNNNSRPLLLFLHGGPGFSSRAYSKKFIKHLKNDFIVAQWDQRGTGITSAWSAKSDSITIGLMHNDTEEVINYLLKKFNKEKLYLVGFSWGGFLGFEFAINHPDLLHAYIPVSAMVHNNESEKRTLQLILDKSEASKNNQAIEDLSKVKIPFDSWEQLYYQRRWTAYYSSSKESATTYPKSLFEEWSRKWMEIFLEASQVDYRAKASKIECPVYFFVSSKDFVANHELAQEYFTQLEANQKELIWFYESTHEIPSDEPKKFSQELLKVVNSITPR